MNLISLFFAGCGKDTVEPAQPEFQKLTIQDLKPADAQPAASQIIFDIVTFELSADKVLSIAPALAQFNPVNLRFYSRELFEKNGLSVYYGRGSDSDELSVQLRLLGVRRTVRTNLITLDKADEQASATAFFLERHVFSTLYGDRTIGETFKPGKIGWVITPSLTVRRDAVNVKIVPAYIPTEGTRLRIAAGGSEPVKKTFGQGRIELTMQEGDFLVLAPRRVSQETTLDKMLFGPEETNNKVRLFVILFNRVGW